MSRNGSGVFTIPNTFVPGTPISSNDENDNFSDISSEITNSVAADGQTTITGQLKGFVSATAAAPAYSFSSDLDTGVYRIGANNVGVSCGGTKILDVSTTGLAVTGVISGMGGIPVGTVVPFAGSSVPTGYLICRGQAVSRTTYAALFTAIGTTYGTGDGSTTFNVPDMGGRVPAGSEASATRLTTAGGGVDGATLGAAGGSQNVTLAAAQIPTLSGITGSNSITVSSGNSGGSGSDVIRASATANEAVGNPGSPSAAAFTLGTTITRAALVSTNPSQTITVAYTNASQTATKTVSPTIILNYIIFAGV